MIYPVVEKFVSINGESERAGELATFIRFRGCNLNCSYCDTKWANTLSAEADMMTLEEIVEYCDETKVVNVTLTGGEPLLQEGINELVCELIKHRHRVEIETNGSMSIRSLALCEIRPVFTLDYKLSSSGMEEHMLLENYDYLTKDDAVKFVAGSQADLLKAKYIIDKYHLSQKCHVYLSPVFNMLDPKDIVQFMCDNKINDVKIQLQLHKYIWNPDKRGV